MYLVTPPASLIFSVHTSLAISSDIHVYFIFQETKFLLPKPALSAKDIKPPQWVNMVQGSWAEVQDITASQAKAEVLRILSQWQLFGSSFFAVS